MDTTSATVLTGAVVAGGHFAKGEKIPPRVFVGVGFLVVFLAAIGQVNERLAEQFATLTLVAAILIYGLPIAQSLGTDRTGQFGKSVGTAGGIGARAGADRIAPRVRERKRS